jgi:hypothetical protein
MWRHLYLSTETQNSREISKNILEMLKRMSVSNVLAVPTVKGIPAALI